MRQLLFLLAISIIFVSCDQSEKTVEPVLFSLAYPAEFGNPVIPDDNLLNPDRIELGRRLFYDKSLSADGSVACASCHLQAYAFSDTVAFSLGFHNREGFRNSPSLANVAYVPLLLRDGGTYSLETQVLVPIEDTLEMNNSILDVAERLGKNKTYQKLAQKAYNRAFDPYVITYSLAAFQRTLVSANSRFDQYKRNEYRLTQDEEAGLQLFMGDRLKCLRCHSEPHFTDNSFRNNGLTSLERDSGRARITFLPEDKGKFRVPTLRNIEFTAPYMHDGSYANLSTVIRAYARGERNDQTSNLIKGFTLTLKEENQLIRFLKTLSDSSFIVNPDYGYIE